MALNSPDTTTVVMPPRHRLTPDVDHPAPHISGTVALLDVWRVVRRQMRYIVAAGLLFGIPTALFVLTRARMYSATTSFLLQASKSPIALPSLAAQFGVTLPGADPGQSPAFYSELVRSRAILSALADTNFTYRNEEGALVTASLADAYHIPNRPAPLRRDELIRRLEDATIVRTSLKSGVITFSITAPAADLAPKIVQALLDELNRFNSERRRSAAAAERRFTERRLREVEADLRKAEQAMQEFLSRNRVANSPQLRFEEQRLSRDVELYRGLYSSMAQSHEQSKIEEVRDTPQITVIQTPEIPARENARMTLGKTLVAIIFGALVGFVAGFARQRVREVTVRAGERAPATA